MKTPHAILGGFALIAVAIVTMGLAGRAGAQGESQARFAVSAAPNYYTVLDVQTDDVRFCIINASCQDFKRQ